MTRRLANFLAQIISVPILLIWYGLGWRTEGKFPPDDKFVLIAAPHTTNWDYANMIALAAYYKRRPYTMVKHTAFEWFIIGKLIKWGGGIPIDRTKSANVVQQVVMFIQQKDRIVLVIAPEGTRKKTDQWKSGFYHIAVQAGLPIALGFLDYKRKRAGVGMILNPSGDIEADMQIIREFYHNHGYGKHPENASDVVIK
jgi:1-acyl-sn-glycerol-3-phosphate acyltransferase